MFASFYEKNPKYKGIAPHRRVSYEERIYWASRRDKRTERRICQTVKDWMEFMGP